MKPVYKLLLLILWTAFLTAIAYGQTQPDVLTTNASGQINRNVKVPSGKTLTIESGGIVGRGTAVLVKDDGTATTFQATADTDAARGTAILAAKTAASAGDAIYVGPGGYAINASLAKDEVDWSFSPRAVVTFDTGAAETSTGIWDDGGTAMQFTVSGSADFARLSSAESQQTFFINCSHASSVMTIEFHDLDFTCGADSSSEVIAQADGKLNVQFNHIRANSGNPAAIWWGNGQAHIHGRLLESNYSGVVPGVDATPTGELHVTIDEVIAKYPVYGYGTNTSAAAWIHANILRSNGAIAQCASVLVAGSNKIYVTMQKGFGPIKSLTGVTGSFLYVEADKVSAVLNGTGTDANLLDLRASSLASWVTVRHWDVNGFTGETMKITNGSSQLWGGDLVCGTAKGLEITGGTLRLEGTRIDTSGSSSQNPVTKSGGTLVLHDAVLVAEATRDSIEAGTAQDVAAYASYANKAVDGNVTITITGGLTVDADVH